MDWSGLVSVTFWSHTTPFVLTNEFEYPSHAAVVVFDLMTSMMQSIALPGLLHRSAFI